MIQNYSDPRYCTVGIARLSPNLSRLRLLKFGTTQEYGSRNSRLPNYSGYSQLLKTLNVTYPHVLQTSFHG